MNEELYAGPASDEENNEVAGQTDLPGCEFWVGEIKELHARNLWMCQVAAKAGNLSATMDALLYCRRNNIKAPAWLLDAAFDLLASAICGHDKKKGPGGNHLARYRQDMKHFVRSNAFEEVRERQEEFAEKVKSAALAKGRVDPDELAYWKNVHEAIGETVESARAAASKLLVGTRAAGSEETIASSCKLVRDAEPGRFKLPSIDVLQALDMVSPWDSGKQIHELLGIPAPKWEARRPPR